MWSSHGHTDCSDYLDLNFNQVLFEWLSSVRLSDFLDPDIYTLEVHLQPE